MTTEGQTPAPRRAKGDHYCRWDPARERWKARASVGYDSKGKRLYVTRFGASKSVAMRRLREALAERERGMTRGTARYTVADAVNEWLEFGLPGRDRQTLEAWRSVVDNHIIPGLGAVRVRDLTSHDVEKWLQSVSTEVGRATLVKARMALRRSLRRAVLNETASRNVAEYVDLPEGRPGRPSKSFTAAQADAVLRGTTAHRLHPYIVIGLLTGARTEELRALRWDHVALEPAEGVPPHIMVWRSVRRRGETKTKKSRRTIALPRAGVQALNLQRTRQRADRLRAGDSWTETGLVFTTTVGGPLNANNLRRDFRLALKSVPGLSPEEWTPRELRHSFVSLLSDAGVPLEEISRLVGHSGTSVTELVYRHQIRPVVQSGASVMDTLFDVTSTGA